MDRVLEREIMAFKLADKNTRFVLPIICPKGKDEVSAETLYNRCCESLGYTLSDHIGDLILDNLNYDAAEIIRAEYPTAAHNEEEMCDVIYAWAADVRRQLNAAEREERSA